MTRSITTVLAVAACIGTLSVAQAAVQTVDVNMNVDTILADSPSGLAGTVNMALKFNSQQGNVTDQLIITLANISAAGSATSAGGLLSGLAFNLPGSYAIGGGSAATTAGSTVVGSSVGFVSGNVSGEWGYANGVRGHFNGLAVDAQVAAMQADTTAKFSNTPIESPAVLDGPEYGLVRTGGDAGGLAAIMNSVTITLTLNTSIALANAQAFLDAINGGVVAIEFGSPNGGGTSVPDGGSTLALLGLGITAIGAFARRMKA